jgi:hypothetical protein
MRPLVTYGRNNCLQFAENEVRTVAEFLYFPGNFFDLFLGRIGFEDNNHEKRSKYHNSFEMESGFSGTGRQRIGVSVYRRVGVWGGFSLCRGFWQAAYRRFAYRRFGVWSDSAGPAGSADGAFLAAAHGGLRDAARERSRELRRMGIPHGTRDLAAASRAR